MCVIIVCPKGTELPDRNILDKARRFNPHGFGFVSESDFFKTMDYEAFIERISKRNLDENVIIHFRYATHGSVKKGNCHPFACRGLYFAHNGVLDIEPIKDMTDSETALRTKIYPVFNSYGFYSKEFEAVCRETAGISRFAFMFQGEVKLFGSYHCYKGAYYSNMRFMDIATKRLLS